MRSVIFKCLLLASTVLFAFSSCDKDDEVDPNEGANEIVEGVQLIGLTDGMSIEQDDMLEFTIDLDKDKIGRVFVSLDDVEVDWFNISHYTFSLSCSSQSVGEHIITLDINNLDDDLLFKKEFSFTILGPDAPIAPETVTDIDGNIYHTVVIGTQVWMVENLKTTKYRNGDDIPKVDGDDAWIGLTSGAYCYYPELDKDKYGGLYNFFAVEDERNISPDGWHVPSREEYQALIKYLGGSSVAAGKMKEAGSENWTTELMTTTNKASNESGFTALPGGCRTASGEFGSRGYIGFYWTSYGFDNSMNDERYGYYRSLYLGDESIPDENNYHGYMGLSVRCIMD